MSGYRTEVPDYSTAHRRVASERGKAVMYPCVDCGAPADEWSYDHADENELQQDHRGRLLTYSASPDHYDPRCRSCHLRFDRRPPAPGPGSTSEKCGTYAGWNQHKAEGSEVCLRCRLAQNDYMREYRARRRA